MRCPLPHGIWVFLCAVLLAGCSGDDGNQARQRPHVLLISAGDIALEDLSVYGGPIPTPNLQRIADLGTVFDRAYSASPQSTAARAALATGRYPGRLDGQFHISSVEQSIKNGAGVPKTVPLISERLKRIGYQTVHVGSWNLGAASAFYPTNRGYDRFWGTLGASTAYIMPRARSARFAPTDAYRRPPIRSRFDTVYTGPRADPVANTATYLTDDMGDEIVRQLKAALSPVEEAQEASRTPLFLWAAFHAPRQPLTARRKDTYGLRGMKSKQRQIYAAMIKALDRNIGKVLDALDSLDALQNSLIIFTADGGCDAKAGTCPCATLRAGAPSLHEGGLRVPLIMAQPARFAGKNRTDTPVISMDVTATILAVANPGEHLDPTLDGQDLSPLANGAKLSPRRVYWQQGSSTAVVSGAMKLFDAGDGAGASLYDLKIDPSETRDIARRQTVQSADMAASLVQWQEGNVAASGEGFEPHTINICGRSETILAPAR